MDNETPTGLWLELITLAALASITALFWLVGICVG